MVVFLFFPPPFRAFWTPRSSTSGAMRCAASCRARSSSGRSVAWRRATDCGLRCGGDAVERTVRGDFYGLFIGKPWENHRKMMENGDLTKKHMEILKWNHRKTIGK